MTAVSVSQRAGISKRNGNEMNEKIYITFDVSVSDSSYSYNAKRKGNADLTLETTRQVLNSLDSGNILSSMLAGALAEFDKPEEEEAK
jgi:arginase family enzyme